MRRLLVFITTLGLMVSHGGLLGIESAKATQVSQAQGCTIRVSNVDELINAFDIASKNGQDDVICIQAGTYTINRTLVYDLTNRLSECGKKLTVRAEGKVVIQPEKQRVMGILVISTSRCRDDKDSDITIQGIIFQNGYGGVGIATNHANVSLINNIFRNDRSLGAAVSTSSGSLYFENNEFINNERGGLEVYTSSGSVNLKNNKFRDNVAPSGGGANVTTGSGAINLTNNVFSNNIAKEYSGGGLKVYSTEGLITLVGNVFVNNRAHDKFAGGGAYIGTFYGTINLINNVFNSNISECQFCSGGGLLVRRDGIDVRRRAGSVTLIGNTFINNKAESRGGGAYFDSQFEAVTLVDNVFYKNTSYEGGGVYAYSDQYPITFVNNTFSMNQSGNVGGGVYVFLRPAYFYNNIFWNNISKNDGHEVYVTNSEKRTVVIAHNLFTPSTHPIAPIDFSRPQNPKVFVKVLDSYNKDIPKSCSTSGSFGNIQADPMFVDPEKGNFRLRAGSPAIDKGCNSAPSIPKTDKDGNQRIWNGIVDMGAYEHGPWPEPKEPDIEIQPQAQPQSQSEQQTQPQRQPQAQPQNTQQRPPSIPDSSQTEERAKEYIKEKSLEFLKDKLFRR